MKIRELRIHKEKRIDKMQSDIKKHKKLKS